jgi:uncharacterized protein YndB with AHSA1/START domain
MAVIHADSTTEIDAPIERCWEVVADLTTAPDWQGGLERLDVVETDDDGRPVVCDTVTDAKFRKVHCRVRVGWEPQQRISFSRIESDDVDSMEAAWELEQLPGGRTRATYRLAVDVGPFGLLARPLEKALRPIVVGARAKELEREVARRG